ncbi:protein of unknown function [Nitrospira defluvii]|uniref:Uncharacterized protein n=1 Tax=Nitrospira defluvii TaxID=330214 RepID=D8PAG8_9BACT|nr:protein of unknown function [Nitrospira defluvii]
MSQLTPLERDILRACSADDVGLWEAVRHGQWNFPHASPDQIKEIVLSALRVLLTARLVDAGRSVARDNSYIRSDWRSVFGPGYDIVSWNLSAEQAIERIRREWDQLGGEPTIGDIVWFVSTTEGGRVLAEGKERNVLKETDT